MTAYNVLRPLAGVSVLERSTTLAASFAGTLLSSWGAQVTVDPTARDGVEFTPSFELQIDRDKALLGDAPAQSYDLIIDDRLCIDSSAEIDDDPASACIRVILQNAPRGEARGSSVSSAHGAVANSGLSIAIGRPDRAPLGLPPGVGESTLGLQAATSVLTEWPVLRESTSEHRITLSLADAIGFYVAINSKMFEGYPRRWHRDGRRASGSAGPYPAAIFDTADAPVGLIGRSSADYQGLIAAMGNPAWASREGFDDPFSVAQNHADEVDRYVQQWVGSKTEGELRDLSLRHGFVIAPVRQIDEVLEEEQHRARCFWRPTGAPRSAVAPGIPWVVRERASRAEPARLSSTDPARPLAGVRVLDMSWVWAGPMATMILADLGADVIKVEHPESPDGSRTRGRPTRFGTPVEGPELEVTPYFHQMNHGKRSVGANLRSREGASVIRDLAATCDVVVENMRPGVLARRGLDYAALSDVNPQVILVSMSLAGQTGPLSGLKGYAPVMGGLSGLEGLIGYAPDDLTGMYTHSFADATAGIYGVAAVMSALLDRETSGQGGWVDLSQVEAAITMLTMPLFESQTPHSRTGLCENDDDRYAFQATIPTTGTDEWLAVTARSFGDATRLAKNLGVTISTNQSRDQVGMHIQSAIRQFMTTHGVGTTLDTLRAAGVSAEPVHSLETRRSVRKDGTLAESVLIDHPYWEKEEIATAPWELNGHVGANSHRAPFLGEHTLEILQGDLGYSRKKIDSLVERGALAMGPVFPPQRRAE